MRRSGRTPTDHHPDGAGGGRAKRCEQLGSACSSAHACPARQSRSVGSSQEPATTNAVVPAQLNGRARLGGPRLLAELRPADADSIRGGQSVSWPRLCTRLRFCKSTGESRAQGRPRMCAGVWAAARRVSREPKALRRQERVGSGPGRGEPAAGDPDLRHGAMPHGKHAPALPVGDQIPARAPRLDRLGQTQAGLGV